jgi:hypothetical protein
MDWQPDNAGRGRLRLDKEQELLTRAFKISIDGDTSFSKMIVAGIQRRERFGLDIRLKARCRRPGSKKALLVPS